MSEQEVGCSPGPSSAASGRTRSVPSIGDFIVIKRGWGNGYRATGPVSRVTAQRCYCPAEYNPNRQAFTDLSHVLVSGAEDACNALAERINSSAALAEQEKRAAADRHAMRVDKIMAEAASTRPASADEAASGMPPTSPNSPPPRTI